MSFSNSDTLGYQTLSKVQHPLIGPFDDTVKANSSVYPSVASLISSIQQFPDVASLLLENRQLKLKLDASTTNNRLLIDRLSEYILLLRNIQAEYSNSEAKHRESETLRCAELDALSAEMQTLRETHEKSKVEKIVLREELEQMKEGFSNLRLSQENSQSSTICADKSSMDLEFKTVYRSPEEMMKSRFDILAQLPVPTDTLVDILKPIGIPERFTLHEFLLGSASGSLKNALSGYCAFTENTTMWCPQREEHGFYLTPLYKCDTGPRSNVTHRWVKVDVKARMPKPTECFYKKDEQWYYTGTYQPFRLEDLTPAEYENLSQSTRDALIKETLAGRKNTTPQVVFETAQLYAAGALKVAVVGVQCVGFNRMLYSVALQQAQRFQTGRRLGGKISAGSDTTKAGTL